MDGRISGAHWGRDKRIEIRNFVSRLSRPRPVSISNQNGRTEERNEERMAALLEEKGQASNLGMAMMMIPMMITSTTTMAAAAAAAAAMATHHGVHLLHLPSPRPFSHSLERCDLWSSLRFPLKNPIDSLRCSCSSAASTSKADDRFPRSGKYTTALVLGRLRRFVVMPPPPRTRTRRAEIVQSAGFSEIDVTQEETEKRER